MLVMAECCRIDFLYDRCVGSDGRSHSEDVDRAEELEYSNHSDDYQVKSRGGNKRHGDTYKLPKRRGSVDRCCFIKTLRHIL